MYVQTTLNGQPLPVRTLGEDVNYMELAADTLTLRADHTFHEIRWLRTTDKRSTPPKVQTISGIFDGTYVDTYYGVLLRYQAGDLIAGTITNNELQLSYGGVTVVFRRG